MKLLVILIFTFFYMRNAEIQVEKHQFLTLLSQSYPQYEQIIDLSAESSQYKPLTFYEAKTMPKIKEGNFALLEKTPKSLGKRCYCQKTIKFPWHSNIKQDFLSKMQLVFSDFGDSFQLYSFWNESKRAEIINWMIYTAIGGAEVSLRPFLMRIPLKDAIDTVRRIGNFTNEEAVVDSEILKFFAILKEPPFLLDTQKPKIFVLLSNEEITVDNLKDDSIKAQLLLPALIDDKSVPNPIEWFEKYVEFCITAGNSINIKSVLETITTSDYLFLYSRIIYIKKYEDLYAGKLAKSTSVLTFDRFQSNWIETEIDEFNRMMNDEIFKVKVKNLNFEPFLNDYETLSRVDDAIRYYSNNEELVKDYIEFVAIYGLPFKEQDAGSYEEKFVAMLRNEKLQLNFVNYVQQGKRRTFFSTSGDSKSRMFWIFGIILLFSMTVFWMNSTIEK